VLPRRMLTSPSPPTFSPSHPLPARRPGYPSRARIGPVRPEFLHEERTYRVPAQPFVVRIGTCSYFRLSERRATAACSTLLRFHNRASFLRAWTQAAHGRRRKEATLPRRPVRKFRAVSDPGPADRGNNFFAGGPSSAVSSGTELVDVSNISAQINAWLVSFTLSGFLGGFSTQDDNAELTAEFLSGASSVGSASTGPVTESDRSRATGLLFRFFVLPPGRFQPEQRLSSSACFDEVRWFVRRWICG
jgi:hypothetical protein